MKKIYVYVKNKKTGVVARINWEQFNPYVHKFIETCTTKNTKGKKK